MTEQDDDRTLLIGPPSAPVKMLGRYELLDRIGKGGMGVVYRARDTQLDRLVAVKMLLAGLDADSEISTRFLREARAAGELNHRNIIQIYDFGEDAGRAFIVMELLEGPHVIEVRAQGGRFVDRRVWEVGAAVALDAETRPAFALVGVAGVADRATTAEVATRVEAALAETTSVLIFSPTPAEMVQVAGDPRVGVGFSDEEATPVRRRELAEAWSELVDTQGVAWLVPVADAVDSYDLWLLASNSGHPDVIRLDLGDVGSRAVALRRLAVALPPIVRTTLHTSVVDVAGIEGAAVIHVASGGAGEAAGLGRGDIIVGAAGTPVTSVADLNDVVARAEPNAELSLDVRGEDGLDSSASIRIALEPDTIPREDPDLLYNKILIDLESLRAPGAVTAAATAVNLAITHMHLGNWDRAISILEGTALPVGPGVSAATVD